MYLFIYDLLIVQFVYIRLKVGHLFKSLFGSLISLFSLFCFVRLLHLNSFACLMKNNFAVPIVRVK